MKYCPDCELNSLDWNETLQKFICYVCGFEEEDEKEYEPMVADNDN